MAIPAMNIATVVTGAAPTIWSLQAIEDRIEKTPLEYLKDYTNTIFRDDENEKNMYPDPNKMYTRSYQVEHRLIGDGRIATQQMIEYEEKPRGLTFTFQPRFVRNAISFNETTVNTDIILADYKRNDRRWLAEWAARAKQSFDLSRMIAGATSVKYGNGSKQTLNTITSAELLGDATFYSLRNQFTLMNTKPVQMMQEAQGKFDYKFYVAMFDETVLNALLKDSSWKTFIEGYFNNYGFENPLAKISYGMKHNILIVPLESEEGFGSALRPRLIVAAAAAGITSGSNADQTVGLPVLSSGTTYTDYVPDGKTSFTKYLSDILTLTGTTSTGVTGCYVLPATGADPIGPLTVKLASSGGGYTVNITNKTADGVGGAQTYTPAAGDIIQFPFGATLGLGAEAYISSYASPLNMIPDDTDYMFNKGMSVNFWEGGAVVKSVRNLVPGIGMNFFYADPTV